MRKIMILALAIGGIWGIWEIRGGWDVATNNVVVRVNDGDTFQLASGKRVRLMGVDSPEYGSCGADAAKKFLTGLVLNKVVRLENETTEAYGRSLANVYVDGAYINEKIMAAGFARPDYRPNRYRDQLTAAFHLAKNAKLGAWSDECQNGLPPQKDCVIKGNIDQQTYEKFYHLPKCRHYNQIQLNLAFGERWFCSEAEATAAGFKRGGGC